MLDINFFENLKKDIESEVSINNKNLFEKQIDIFYPAKISGRRP